MNTYMWNRVPFIDLLSLEKITFMCALCSSNIYICELFYRCHLAQWTVLTVLLRHEEQTHTELLYLSHCATALCINHISEMTVLLRHEEQTHTELLYLSHCATALYINHISETIPILLVSVSQCYTGLDEKMLFYMVLMFCCVYSTMFLMKRWSILNLHCNTHSQGFANSHCLVRKSCINKWIVARMNRREQFLAGCGWPEWMHEK